MEILARLAPYWASNGAPTGWSWLAAIVLAPCIGSLLGVLIQRLPEGRPLALARSACERCGETLGPLDLVPLASYALSRGKCRHCGEAIGSFAPAIELAALAVAIWAALAVSDDRLWASCALGWVLLTLAWIDARTMLLPDVLTLPLLLGGLLVNGLADPDALADRAAAAALGYLLLAGLALGYRYWRGRDGIGMGDTKLLAALGAWIGLSALPRALLLAACAGLLWAGVTALAGGRVRATTAIPFGPFLALAGWLVWLYPDWLVGWLAPG